jgi:hypothetical protein
MRVNKYLIPVLVAIALLGSVGVAQATGAWEGSGKQEISSGGLVGSDEVRGWMTLQQIADGFGLGIEELYALLGLPTDLPPESALKELEGLIPDFETSSVRELLAVYLGEAGAVAPAETPVVATPAATPTAAIPVTPEVIAMEHAGPTPLPAGAVLAASELKGRHTLLEIAEQCQVPLEALLAALKLPADFNANAAIKDLAAAGTIESVEVVRDVVLQLQAR